MIEIIITGHRTGKRALLYQFDGKKGGRRFVPTYTAFAKHLPTGKSFRFAVVRDSSTLVFGGHLKSPYDEEGECPPSRPDTPYVGTIRTDGSVGFRIELFEPACSHDPFKETIVGQGTTPRRNVQIHFGAAASEGCILVAGRRRLYPATFERPLRAMGAGVETIEVIVEPRDPLPPP